MSTHMSTSYLNICIRLHLNMHGITNLHLLAIPVYERRTTAVIFTTTEKTLDILCLSWKDTVIVISMDGERKMNGHILGVAKLFKNVAKPVFIRIWCVAHHIDIILQGSHPKFGDNDFRQKLMRLILYLWIKNNIIFEIRPKTPNVADTCWELMGKSSNWFKKNNIEIDMDNSNKQPEFMPCSILWIYLMIISKFSHVANTNFKSLQGHHVTATIQ